MSDSNKPPYDKKHHSLLHSIVKPTDRTVSLVDVSLLSSFEDYPEIHATLADAYSKKCNRYENWATFLNALFTQKTSSFLFCRSIMQALVKKDKNYSRRTMGNTMFERFRDDLINGSGTIELVEKAAGPRAGFFRLKEGVVLDLLINMVGRDVLEAKFKSNYEYFKKTNAAPSELTTEIYDNLKIKAKK